MRGVVIVALICIQVALFGNDVATALNLLRLGGNLDVDLLGGILGSRGYRDYVDYGGYGGYRGNRDYGGYGRYRGNQGYRGNEDYGRYSNGREPYGRGNRPYPYEYGYRS